LFEEALAASHRAIELEPDNAAYVSDIGWTLILAERYQEAEAAFLRALAIDPSNERAQANLEYCRQRLSERPASMSSEVIQPTSPDTKERRGSSNRKKRVPRHR
jgi:tetratricopeptide (TPR) repeat protein